MNIKTVLAIIAIAALGFGAALLAFPRLASAWDYGSLPSGCSQGGTQYDASGPNYAYKVLCNGVLSGWIHYGSNPYPQAPTDPTWQGNLDSFVNAHYTAPVMTTAATTTAPATTSTSTSTTPTPTTTVAATTPVTTTTVTATTTAIVTTTAVAAAAAPTASFTTAATGLAVTFTDASKAVAPATIATITWDFGDGANGVGSTVKHVYATGGTFSVREFVTDTNGLGSPASADITTVGFNTAAGFSETLAPKLGVAATTAFGQPVAVYCVRSWGTAKPEHGYGLSIVGWHQVNIWQAGCNALVSKKGPVAQALWVIAHEAAHALGIKSEKTADCFASRSAGKLEVALKIKDAGYRVKIRKQVIAKWKRC